MKTLSKLTIAATLLTGCTFAPAERDVRVVLELEKPGGKSFLTSAAAADCYAVNIVGPGIPDAIPQLATTDLYRLLAGQTKCAAPGISSGLVSGIGGSTIDLQVPTGPDRFVQVIGIEFPTGSPFTSCDTGMNLAQMIAYADSLNLTNGVDSALKMYLLGVVRKGLFVDQEVNVPNTYDPSNPVNLNDCNAKRGSPLKYPGLKFWGDMTRDETLTCSGACTASSDILAIANMKNDGLSLIGSSTVTPTFQGAVFPNSQTHNVAYFDGADDYLHMNNAGVFSTTTEAITIMLLYRLISDGPSKTFLSLGPAGNIYSSSDHIQLWKNNAAPGDVIFEFFESATPLNSSRVTGPIPLNAWLFDVYTGSAGNGFKSFRNGNFTGSSAWPSGATVDLGGRFGVGCFYEDGVGCDPVSNNFDGEITEIILYDRELQAFERVEIECRIKQFYGVPVNNVLCP